jgi:intracellular multiplication protein IcmB
MFGLLDAFDSLLASFAIRFKQPIWAFNRLETTSGAHTLVTDDGSLVTILHVSGTRRIMGPEELEETANKCSLSFAPFLDKTGHAIDVWFARDPTFSSETVRRLLFGARGTSKAIHLNLSDLFSERQNHLSKFIAWEGLFFVLWSRMSLLTSDERKTANRAAAEKRSQWPTANDAQYALRGCDDIQVAHDSFVSAALRNLKTVDIRADPVEVHEALRLVRTSIYPDMLTNAWKPCLPGDKVPARWPERLADQSHILWPLLNEQLFDRDAERISSRLVRIGDLLFAGIDMTLGPLETKPFALLLAQLTDVDQTMPWRIRFTIEGNGLGLSARKSFAASMLAVTANNKQIKKAFDDLRKAVAEEQTAGVVRLRISLATWGPHHEEDLVRNRASRLARAMESWGYCQVGMVAGDPLACAMGSTLGLDLASTAVPAAANIEDVMDMLPWGRSASPWASGPVLFRTLDGRPWPYQPGSAKFTTWFSLLAGGPGGSKSVLAATIHLGRCLSSDVAGQCDGRLPPIGIIDVGPSSAGLISLLRESLPPERRHEALYERLTLSAKKAINPFDTQLGARQPLPRERSFLVNFLALLMTEPGDAKPPRGTTPLVSAIIEAVYDLLSDQSTKGRPKRYVVGEEPEVDVFLSEYSITIDPQTTWWELVDALFDRNLIRLAAQAQRRAVPLLEDTVMAARSHPAVKDLFETAKIEGGEALLTSFERSISSVLNEFPNLSAPTKFDVADARVVSLDLEDVVGGEGPAAGRASGVMYLLSRYVVGRNFYLHENEVSVFPARYQPYQRARIKMISGMPKSLFYDELHKTASAAPLIHPVIIDDGRLGRKYGVEVRLASQMLSDFTPEMVELATEIFIVKSAGPQGNRHLKKVFDLNATAIAAIERHLNGPGPGGAPFLGIFHLTEGIHQHLLVNTLGPIELWAFATGKEDRRLRDGLYQNLGPPEARRQLAQRFPSGSAKTEIERRLAALEEMAAINLDPEEGRGGVIDTLIHEITSKSTASRNA